MFNAVCALNNAPLPTSLISFAVCDYFFGGLVSVRALCFDARADLLLRTTRAGALSEKCPVAVSDSPRGLATDMSTDVLFDALPDFDGFDRTLVRL